MTDEPESDWVHPSAVQASAAAPPNPTGAARRAAGATGATPTTSRRSATPGPSWADEPTEPVPVVPVEVGAGGGEGGGARRGGGGGGGGGGNGAVPRANAARTLAVILVVGFLMLPFVAAAVWLVLHLGPSSGGSAKKTAPRGPQAGEYKLFLRPGLTLSQIADVAATLPGHTKAGFLAVANSGQIRSHYQPATTNSLEGLLAPDTYFVGTTESDGSVLRRLVNHFDLIGDQIGLANLTGLQPYQVTIIASMVQQEAKLASDAPLVAAVIYNRIRLKLPLQIDATLCYAKGGCPPVPNNADKKLNSPYNTYKVAGLPPTPIASVTQASLQAAMTPPQVPYLYYVISDANGKLAFAKTLQEQQANTAAAHRKGLL